jgi:hypothetical protein
VFGEGGEGSVGEGLECGEGRLGETVKGVMEPAWEIEIDAWETMVR